jgi:putative ABC transport system permease protein
LERVTKKVNAWGETVNVAMDALRADKLKAALTMLGVIIGSACIVLVVTVALTGKRYIIQQIEGVGANLTYAQLMRSGKVNAIADEISLADLRAVQTEIPQVVDAAATRDQPATVITNGVERPISLVGVTEGFQRIRNLEILRGRFFDAQDLMSGSKVALVTDELKQVLFPHEDPIGKTIKLGELGFTVIGVFRERVSTFGQSEIQKESAIIPFDMIHYFTGNDYTQVLYAQARSPEDVPAVTRHVTAILHSRHRPDAVYDVENLSAILEATKRISQALTAVLLIVAFIALTISGVGIMNIMLVTVTQRTREIGIRKAVGARDDEIRYQFLIEAFLISGAGALSGIALAIGIRIAVQPLLPQGITVPISWLSIFIAFSVSCIVGVLFGFLPANNAAKLVPTEALRYE